ncbi:MULTISPECIES: DUF1491 family protein [unclassified Sphingomonas]|jgi:hypothetical protein|uniref:DUF1491 family protein n=1 Tax=unclassified Sphingomonas TaxID=196159 RepID=UPI0004DED042|nr:MULTISPECIES: DUF1491 family protein [unclassified Sphingomonas]KHA64977.1 hypothetical protein NI18_05105 [Sphingomonas sp. Ant20]MBD8469692.1 DUF1491 family protein [Sphingomonas sp. CFBP 8765]MDY1009055.1 DUF1491 family protein [Sphingomonas sp. CFBP9019]
MSGRLPSGVLVSALLRRVNDAGGFGAVLAKGDAQSGAILVVAIDRGALPRLLERGIGADGRTALIDSTPSEDLDGYWRRRRSRDPDLWVIEVDVAAAERFAAETILAD